MSTIALLCGDDLPLCEPCNSPLNSVVLHDVQGYQVTVESSPKVAQVAVSSELTVSSSDKYNVTIIIIIILFAHDIQI